MILYWVLLVVTAVISYLIGSLSTLVLASNFIFHTNLRRLGRGNTFIVNFRRVYGIKGALKLLAVELVRDFLPILIGGLLLGIKGHADVGRAFAGFCLVMGRCFPAFYGFRGSSAIICLAVAGLCQSTSLGILIVAFYIALVFVTKRMSVAAFVSGFTFALFSLLTVDQKINIILMAFCALLVVIRQIPAIIRVSKGQEEKLSLKEDLSYKFDEKF